MVPILFIAYHFPPAGGAGVQRSQKFVRYLPAEGFLPIVVTGPVGAGDRWSPGDAALATELPSEVRVFRAPGPIPQGNGRWSNRLGRWLGASNPFSEWWIQAATPVASAAIDGAKLIFATMSPFATAHVAGEVSRRTGIPWIADLRDPWALDEMQVYPSWIHRQLELRQMGQLLSSAAGVIMNTPEATVALRNAFPAFQEKPVVTITNGYDAADFVGAEVPRADGKFRIVHTGYLHTKLGLKLRNQRALYQLLGGIEGGVEILTRSHVILLKAVAQWLSQRPEVARDLEIVFAGVTSGPDRAVVTNSALSSVIRFTDYVPHSESVQLVRTADLLFLPMHNLSAGRRSRIVPGKTYEYMAAARPILAAVPEGDARDFLQQSGVAFLCKPAGVEGMIRELDRVYSAWKNRAAIMKPDLEFISKFDRLRLTQELGGFFKQILKA